MYHIPTVSRGKNIHVHLHVGGNEKSGGPQKAKKKITVASEFLTQLNQLLLEVGSTDNYFVRCVKPNQAQRGCFLGTRWAGPGAGRTPAGSTGTLGG